MSDIKRRKMIQKLSSLKSSEETLKSLQIKLSNLKDNTKRGELEARIEIEKIKIILKRKECEFINKYS